MPRHRRPWRPTFTAALMLAVIIGPVAVTPARAAHTHVPSASAPAGGPACPAPEEFPPSESMYHGYGEILCDIEAVARTYPDIVQVGSIGTSYRGRDIPVVRISDNVTLDEREPEVLFDGLHHTREHLSGEMALSVIHLLAEGYGFDARITGIVDSLVIWVVPVVNPDGYAWELGHPDGTTYRNWRKNRQPNGPGEPKGTDLNRNYAFKWGGRGSSGDPGSVIYRGAAPFSAPEAAAMRDFILGRIRGGRQRITSHISFHTAGEQILYPYSYTLTDIPPAMTDLDHEVFVEMAGAMAATTGYTPMQASDLYLHSGTGPDWSYARQRIFSFTFELYPAVGTRIYPVPDEDIIRETERNHDAILYLLEHADCPYRAVGNQASHCGPLFDDLEADRGWTVDPPDGVPDTATGGIWARGDPRATATTQPIQLEDAWSGRHAFVTGLKTGGCAGCNDVDDGFTTVRSRVVGLPASGPSRLRLRYFLGHGVDADAGDGLRVAVIRGTKRTLVASRLAMPGVVAAAAWKGLSVDLGPWAGTSIRIQLEARDGAGPSLVEVGVDEVRITGP